MLSEALPIYSGGLGNVAGDQLKAASDLGVPVIGVGLLYQQGHFRQVIDKNGAQQTLFPYNDPGQLPITPLRQANGEWLRLEIALPGYSVWLRAWQVQVGRVKLYLLDSNDAANYPAHRGITSELYGGGPELRLKQELLLGIGGWRLLAALGIEPEVCHLNEGHAAFAVLERARSFMQASGQPFEVALAVTRAGNVFTTHMAVAAGFDRFAPALIEQYLAGYAEQKLGITRHDLLALGRQNPNDSSEPFNMAYLAIRGSGAVNGVSRLHGKVSRHLFEPLFPHWPTEEIPVGHVTNGVHMPTWDSAPADDLCTEVCGKDRWLGTAETLEKDIRQVSDASLWEFRTDAMIDGRELHATLSIGISIYPDDGIHVDTVMQNADTAMHHAKASGRDNSQFFRADMNIRAVRRLFVEDSLRRALKQGEFLLHYQPKIDLASGVMTGTEALIRWFDPDLGLVYPGQFVPIAEECGLIVPIGRWVLREACRQVRAWLDSGLRAVPVAVNISAVEFRHEGFLAGVALILKQTGLAPQYLELELTETILMHDAESSASVLQVLKAMGVRLAVDDFGTGYSSLSYLKRFPIDTLKIDQSFVRDIATDADDTTIVSAVIGMGKSLKQRVIAEGVETQGQLDFLRKQRCDEGQGFHFSHPLSAEDFARLLVPGNDELLEQRPG